MNAENDEWAEIRERTVILGQADLEIDGRTWGQIEQTNAAVEARCEIAPGIDEIEPTIEETPLGSATPRIRDKPSLHAPLTPQETLYGAALAAALAEVQLSEGHGLDEVPHLRADANVVLRVKCGSVHDRGRGMCGSKIAAVVDTEQGQLFWGQGLDTDREIRERSWILERSAEPQIVLLGKEWAAMTEPHQLAGTCWRHGLRSIDRAIMNRAIHHRRAQITI